MAAPTEAYTGLSLYQNDCEHSIAKLDTDYDTMKTRFYLDEVVGTKEGVVGLVDPSGIKAQYHNLATRQGKGRFGNYVALNDGGLNTLGTVSIGALSSSFGSGVIIPITYRNAYYVDSDGIKIRYKKNSDVSWTEYFSKGTTPQGEYLTYNGAITSVGGDLSPDDVVYVTVQNINAEGTFTSTQQSITLPFPSLVMSYGAYSSEAWTNYGSNTSKTDRYFSEYEPAVGVEVYGNSSGFINLTAGYYASPDFWIKVELTASPDVKSVITKIGAIGVWDTGDPSTPSGYGTFNFIHKEASSPLSRWNQGCSLVGTGGGNAYTAYRSNTDNKFYQETTLNNLISNAYYYTSTTEFLIISGGVSIGTGDCTNGPVFPSEE